MLKHERQVTIVSLVGIVLASWFYLIAVWLQMGMDGTMSSMATIKSWTISEFISMFVMWTVMMIGMMIPSAAPMILLYERVCRKHRISEPSLIPTSTFFSGYVLVWTAFSLIATILQWVLAQAALLSPMMVSTSHILSGIILVLAGIYQWTPAKSACLMYCRSPVEFLSNHWHKGTWGALRMGLEHGSYCLGCCWALMALLFVGGVMNLFWIAAIAAFVLVEKVMRAGQYMGRLGSILLVLSGFFFLIQD